MGLLTPPRRVFLLSALAVLIGLAGGAAAYVLVHLIALLTNLAFFHRVDWTLPSFTKLDRSPTIILLAVELLLFEFSTRALLPLIIGSSVAAGMHTVFFGAGPLFHVPPHHFAGLSQLPVYALLGLACGALAIVINQGLFAIERGFHRL